MYERYIKRILDITISLMGIMLFILPAIIIAIAIKLNSRGEIIFRHTRCGRDNQPFTFYKFRSFTLESPDYLPTRDVKDAAYITGVGKVLRKLSLDEMPQLWNVLRGDMSIVGPRPVVFEEKRLIRRRTENGVNQIRPGITGWAQINGRDTIGPEKKAKLDGEYKDRMSFTFDMYCLLLTVWTVIFLKGHAEGYSDMHQKIIEEEFKATTQ